MYCCTSRCVLVHEYNVLLYYEGCFSTRRREPEVPPPSYTIQSDCSSPALRCFDLHCLDKLSMQIFTRSELLANNRECKHRWSSEWLKQKGGRKYCKVKTRSSSVHHWIKTRTASSILSATVGTVEEVSCLRQQHNQNSPHCVSLRGVVVVVWWWRETSPKNLVDLFSESEQAARSVYAAASCQRSHCSTKTHSSPPPPSPNSGFEIGPQVLSTLGETLITQLCMWTSDGSSWNQKFCNNKKFRDKSLTNDKRKLCFFEDFPIC